MRIEERIAPYPVQANLLVPLGEVCKTTSGGTPSRKNTDYFSGPIPWVKSGELPDGPVVEIDESISEEALRQSSAKLFPAGTLLMALYGATVGKLGILTRPAATNQAVCAIFPPPDLDTKFLFWFLRFKRSDLVAQAVGGAQPNISQGIVRDLKIPLLPLDQQKRIVAEIEKQFSRLDEAVANLKRVKANLKRYKAAVLKAAVEGRLVETEAERARREGRSYETGAQLLQRILETRRSQWQGKGKYKEPAAPETTSLPELPEGWSCESLEVIAEVVDPNPKHRNPRYEANGYVFLSTAQFSEPDGFDLTTAKHVSEETVNEQEQRCSFDGRSIAFSRKGTIGKTRFLPTGIRFALLDSLCVINCSDQLSEKFLNYQLMGSVVQKQITVQTRGVALKQVSVGAVRGFVVPLPPLAEQHRVVAEVDRRLSLLCGTEAQVDASLQRAARLRQSVLQSSFRLKEK